MSNSMPDIHDDEALLRAQVGAPPRGCPPVDVLMAYGQEVLPAEVEQRVEKHVAGCGLCAMLLADMATLPEVPLSPAQAVRIREGLPSIEVKRSQGAAWSWRGMASIAAAVLVCATAGTVAYRRSHAREMAADTKAPVATKVAALEIPLAPLAPPQDGAMVTRGAHRGDDPPMSRLMPAFTAYNAADYKSAVAGLTPLAVEYPRSETVLLYLGVSQLFLKQDAAAAATLAQAQALPSLQAGDAAQWYAAIAAQRLHSVEARKLLSGLCADAASPYSAESCRIAPTLP